MARESEQTLEKQCKASLQQIVQANSPGEKKSKEKKKEVLFKRTHLEKGESRIDRERRGR